jgi:hypothetical protein
VGYQSFYSSTGAAQVGLGYQAGYNSSGSNNLAIGYQALYSNTGTNIYGIGYQALYNNTGADNYAYGYQSLNANTSGGNNVAMGLYTLKVNTTGGTNTAIGNYALYSNTTASNNTAVGYQAGYANTIASGQVFLGYQAGTSATGANSTYIGYQAGFGITTGDSNVFIGNSAGYSNQSVTTGSANVYIGNAASGSAAGNNREVVIGFNLKGQGSSTATIGCDNGKIYNSFTVNATWTQTSDGRMKTNVQNDSLGLSFINRLRPVKFTWKPSNELEQDNPYYAEENKRDTTTVIHGLIAQDVKAALDAEGVDTFAGWDMGADGIQAISREMFISPLIKAIQELKTIVDTQAAEIVALKAKVGL